MEHPIPVILCGKTAEIAVTVVKGLQPEVEVIQVILNVPTFTTTVPGLLSTPSTPPSPDASLPSLGTQNFSRRPVAIVTGGGFDDAMVAAMRASCTEAGVDDIPFLRPDSAVPTPPLGPKYGAAMVGRVKTCIQELEEEGRLVGGGVFYY